MSKHFRTHSKRPKNMLYPKAMATLGQLTAVMSDVEMAPAAAAPQEPTEETEVSPEEYEMLDARLDDLNSALDLIEQKNDHIHSEFIKLLQSNKEIREELKKEAENPTSQKNE